MEPLLFSNARIFDGRQADLVTDRSVLVEGGMIRAIPPESERPSQARQIDLEGCVLMPGLIDAHYHAYISDLDFVALDKKTMSNLAHPARKLLEDSLHRGFTSVRDFAGGQIMVCGKQLRKGFLPKNTNRYIGYGYAAKLRKSEYGFSWKPAPTSNKIKGLPSFC
ncbi:amidohydrolase family protein [Emcibacter nanhaiensis]|uniref:Amidohydrolase family protein n=1 Tax=Emcibacter nanhaiensis TaxID=1505037 RepID=A0A501PJQ2_9PROT|nr:hypothetical protein [Emcibacter nanhaiensis]TPD60241.1 hypothetical protein FIV46_09320 [Emcibacter nanhaiensis]